MAFSMEEQFQIVGLNDLMDRLAKFPIVIRTAFRRAARKIGGQVAKIARAKAPSRKAVIRVGDQLVRMYGASLALKKSIAVKVITTKKGIVTAIVGPKKGTVAKVFIAYFKPSKSKVAQRNVMIEAKPTKYAHLVEKGFNAKIWASNKRIRVSAKPFLRPALDSGLSTVSSITVEYLQMSLDNLIAKGKITPDAGDV
jgi:hypothetical protein